MSTNEGEVVVYLNLNIHDKNVEKLGPKSILDADSILSSILTRGRKPAMVFRSVLLPFFLQKLGELSFLLESFVPMARQGMDHTSNKHTAVVEGSK